METIPPRPGVYLFKDGEGNFLYVGKAANLRHRVGSYFQKSPGREGGILGLGGRATDVETIVTDTEKEAFILEDNLIKQHRPRYNIRLRDDKYYPCLRLSAEEKIPTLSIVRRIHNDGALYFGPYPSARSLRETVKLIRKIFPIRTSLDTEFSPRLPAWTRIDPEGHQEVVGQVRMLLEGKDRALLRRELLNYFGSVERISEASAEELLRVPSMNRRAAEAVFDFFHPREGEGPNPKHQMPNNSDAP